jgi:hypothetical protein
VSHLPQWFITSYGWFGNNPIVHGPACEFYVKYCTQDSGILVLRWTRCFAGCVLDSEYTPLLNRGRGSTPELRFTITEKPGLWICDDLPEQRLWFYATGFDVSDPPHEFRVYFHNPTDTP